MPSLFLYEKTFNEQHSFNQETYTFPSCNLIAIDIDKIKKQDRLLFVSRFKLREFFILQRWLIKFIESFNKFGILLKDIHFYKDDEIDESDKQKINNLIEQKDYLTLSKFIDQIRDEYGTDIKFITFVFNTYNFKLFSTGILEAFSEDELKNILKKKEIWMIISGYSNNW